MDKFELIYQYPRTEGQLLNIINRFRARRYREPIHARVYCVLGRILPWLNYQLQEMKHTAARYVMRDARSLASSPFAASLACVQAREH